MDDNKITKDLILNEMLEKGKILYKNRKQDLILIFNNLDDEKEKLKVGFEREYVRFFGLTKNIKDKKVAQKKYYQILEILLNNSKENKDFYEKEFFKKFQKEFLILWKWVNYTNQNIDRVKIYKSEAPDFIIETENEIIPIEISLAGEDSKSHYFEKNALQVERDIQEKGCSVIVSNYEEISIKNIEKIEEKFQKNEKYLKNVKNIFKNKRINEIIFLIPLGIVREYDFEKENLLKIKSLLAKMKIKEENLFIEIGSDNKESNYWFNFSDLMKEK